MACPDAFESSRIADSKYLVSHTDLVAIAQRERCLRRSTRVQQDEIMLWVRGHGAINGAFLLLANNLHVAKLKSRLSRKLTNATPSGLRGGRASSGQAVPLLVALPMLVALPIDSPACAW